MNIKNRISRLTSRLLSIPHRLSKIQEALGRIEQRQIAQMSGAIENAEFRVYSQWGEDGIIQYLVNQLSIPNKVFVEFGVENYLESNTRFLLINNNWSGLVIDGSQKHIDYIKSDSIYWSHNVKAECEFITIDNINDIFLKNGIKDDIGLLSVDIDGNDYWVWESINCIQPRIVVAEYNSLFGPHAKVSTPYTPSFYRGDAHYSKVYYGASIAALTNLASQKGYSLVGSNIAGNNIFFVRDDLLGSLKVMTPAEAYRRAQFREFHDEQGALTYYDFDARIKALGDMEVQDVETKKLIRISELHFTAATKNLDPH